MVTYKKCSSEEVFVKKYPDITLEKGRSVTDLDEMKLSIKEAGYYIFEYMVIQSDTKQ